MGHPGPSWVHRLFSLAVATAACAGSTTEAPSIYAGKWTSFATIFCAGISGYFVVTDDGHFSLIGSGRLVSGFILPNGDVTGSFSGSSCAESGTIAGRCTTENLCTGAISSSTMTVDFLMTR